EVARKAVVHGEPVAEKDPESARRQPIVLVDLRDALGEIVDDVVDRMRERYVDQRAVGKDAFDLAAKRRVETVVVVGVQESAPLEILAQARDLGVAEMDVAVTREMDERIVPQLVVHQRDARLGLVDLERGSLANCGEQVWEARRIRVPVAAAVVLQARDREHRRVGPRRRARAGHRGEWKERQEWHGRPRPSNHDAHSPRDARHHSVSPLLRRPTDCASRYATRRGTPKAPATDAAASRALIPASRRASTRSRTSSSLTARAGAPPTINTISPRGGFSS